MRASFRLDDQSGVDRQAFAFELTHSLAICRRRIVGKPELFPETSGKNGLGRHKAKDTKVHPFTPSSVAAKFVELFCKEWRKRRDSSKQPLP